MNDYDRLVLSKIEKLLDNNIVPTGDNFFKIRRSHFPVIKEMGKASLLFFYMTSWITTDRARGIWKQKVTPYFTEHNLLPFCKQQEFISKDLEMPQNTVSTQLKLLHGIGVIKRIGSESFNNKAHIDVYSLGYWLAKDDGSKSTKYYFYHLDIMCETYGDALKIDTSRLSEKR